MSEQPMTARERVDAELYLEAPDRTSHSAGGPALICADVAVAIAEAHAAAAVARVERERDALRELLREAYEDPHSTLTLHLIERMGAALEAQP